MKVFERLVKSHICSSIPVTLDPLQFAYRPNRSTDDAISHILHSSLKHIDSSNGNYARLLFIDYSSAFNTIVPIKLASKLTDLGLNTSLCDWIQDFLILTVSFAHITFCVLVSYFFEIAATCQPCTTNLHIPLLYSHAHLILIFKSTVYYHAHFIFCSLYLFFFIHLILCILLRVVFYNIALSMERT